MTKSIFVPSLVPFNVKFLVACQTFFQSSLHTLMKVFLFHEQTCMAPYFEIYHTANQIVLSEWELLVLECFLN